eukprot:678882-Rhodomonas_salina.4
MKRGVFYRIKHAVQGMPPDSMTKHQIQKYCEGLPGPSHIDWDVISIKDLISMSRSGSDRGRAGCDAREPVLDDGSLPLHLQHVGGLGTLPRGADAAVLFSAKAMRRNHNPPENWSADSSVQAIIHAKFDLLISRQGLQFCAGSFESSLSQAQMVGFVWFGAVSSETSKTPPDSETAHDLFLRNHGNVTVPESRATAAAAVCDSESDPPWNRRRRGRVY